MQINTYQPGILQGVVVPPSGGDPVDIRYIGSPLELMSVASFFNLEPLGEPEDTGLQQFKDSRGGYATLQPVGRASDLLMTVMSAMRGLLNGDDESPF